MAINWETVKIKKDNGEVVEAKAPVVISASRSTDIPAFFAKWFILRLDKGYCTWYNPFDKSKPYYVSFKNTKVVVFWTKNPRPLIPYLKELDNRGINYYFQFTINDYENEGYEPNVASLENRIETFKELSKLIGKDRVIWRFDPIIITPGLSIRDIHKKIWNIGNKLKGYTNKLVFSFVDIDSYKKVQNNMAKTALFNKETVLSGQPNYAQISEIVDGIVKLQTHWRAEGWDLTLATCAEDVDLSQYNIIHNKCIDDDLMRKCFSHDEDLMYFLDYGELKPKYQLFDNFALPRKKKMKDSGQRKACGCVYSKDIGMYNTCRHHCTYCYANTSFEVVEKNFKLHTLESESIID